MSRDNLLQHVEQDLSTTSAFKITLPDNVFQELSDYADALSLTKSDAIKEAVKEKISKDPAWLSKIFIFKSQSVNKDTIADLKESLKTAKKGAMIKVAGSYENKPAYANGWIFQLISFDDDYVYIEPPVALPPTFLNAITNDISMEKGTVNVPKVTTSPGLLGTPFNHLTYKVPLEYVWGIDCNNVPTQLPYPNLTNI